MHGSNRFKIYISVRNVVRHIIGQPCRPVKREIAVFSRFEIDKLRAGDLFNSATLKNKEKPFVRSLQHDL